jgi:hypothetical protein
MEPKNLNLNVRISRSEKQKLKEIAKRLKTNKEATAFRYALAVAYEATDPQKNPDALKNILVLV